MDGENYNYSGFRKHMVQNDLHFPGGPEPGQVAPEIELPTIDGHQFRLSDYRGKRPVLIQFGSIT